MAGIEEELQLGECGAKCEWWCGQRYDDASGWAHGSAPYPWTKHHAEPGAEEGEEGLGKREGRGCMIQRAANHPLNCAAPMCTEEEEVGEGEEDDEEAAERRRLVQEERRKQKMYQRAVKVWGKCEGHRSALNAVSS